MQILWISWYAEPLNGSVDSNLPFQYKIRDCPIQKVWRLDSAGIIQTSFEHQ